MRVAAPEFEQRQPPCVTVLASHCTVLLCKKFKMAETTSSVGLAATILDPRENEIEEWPLRPDSPPIDISIINFDRRTPDSQAATLAGHHQHHHHRSLTPVTINFERRNTPDSMAATKRSRRSSITDSGEFSIGNFSFEQFPFQGELKEKLDQHVRRSHIGAGSISSEEEGVERVGDEGERVHPIRSEDGSIYPDSTSLILIMVALCLAVFCVSDGWCDIQR